MSVIINIWKHHLNETKRILKYYSLKNLPENKIIPLISKLGNSEFDLYIGNLTIKEILYDFKNSEKIQFKKNLFFICQDKSLWVLKKFYKNNIDFIHIFPARKSILKEFNNLINSKMQIRIHSNTYKTLLFAYWIYLSPSFNSKNIFEIIEKSREKLSLSKMDFNKSK